MKLSTLFHALGLAVLLWIVYLFTITIIEHSEDFSRIDWNFSLPWLLIATLLLIAHFILNGVGLQMALALFHERTDFRSLLAIRLVSDIGRYLPGKIWKFAGRAHYSAKIGISKTMMLVASFIEEISNLVSAGIVSFAALGSLSVFLISTVAWIIILCVLILGIILLYSSGTWNWIINPGLRMLNRPQLPIHWTFIRMTKLVAWYAALWVLLGISFYSFVRSFTYVPLSSLPWIASLFVGAWVISYISFLTPGGIGIREGLLALGLNIWLSPSYSVVISIASRLWIMLIEGGLAFWGWRTLRSLRINNQPL